MPLHLRATPPDPRKSTDPANVQAYLGEAWGEYGTGPGELPVVRSLENGAPPPPGPHRRRVARLAHVSDLQLLDDKSPARLAAFDGPSPIEGAFRPQEGYICHVVHAVVRTINAIHKDAPLDLVLMGGDNADNAQDNEIGWVLSILDGGEVICDSGNVDGAPGGVKAPFTSEGLDPPWYWVTGNHDILSQGNVVVDDKKIAESVGDFCAGGTRDYTKPGAPIVKGTIVPDVRRKMLKRPDLMQKIAASQGKSGPKGHGLGDYAAQTGKAFFAIDLPGSPVRFIVMDTAAETGTSEAVLHRADLDAFVRPAMASAVADKKWVVFASHHAVDRMGDGSGFGGTKQDDAVMSEEWEALLTSWPNVILDLVGHAHDHRIRRLGSVNAKGVWEVQTGAIADFPSQFRLIEIWDEDNGQVSVRSSGVDYLENDDVLVHEARRLMIMDWTTGWGCCGPGTAEDRNVVLWGKAP